MVLQVKQWELKINDCIGNYADTNIIGSGILVYKLFLIFSLGVFKSGNRWHVIQKSN